MRRDDVIDSTDSSERIIARRDEQIRIICQIESAQLIAEKMSN